VQRSFTVHGDRTMAEDHRQALAERFGVDRRALYCESARWTLGELLARFIDASHEWRPATRSSHASVVRYLIDDPLGDLGLTMVTRWWSIARSPAGAAPAVPTRW
jgi:hypothetical protein